MRLIALKVENVKEQNTVFDFSATTAKLAVVKFKSPELLKELIKMALFGDDCCKEGKLELTFSNDGDIFVLARNFEANVTFLKDNDGELISDSNDEIASFLVEMLRISPEAYSTILSDNTEYVFDKLIKDEDGSGKFFLDTAKQLDLDNADLAALIEKLKDEKLQLETKIELLGEGASPEEITALKNEISAIKSALSDMKVDFDLVTENLAKAEKGKLAEDDYNADRVELEKQLNKKLLMDELAGYIKQSEQAELIIGLYAKKHNIDAANIELKGTIASLEDEIKNLSRKIEAGDKASKDFEKEFIYASERLIELRKKLYSLLECAEKKGDEFDIKAEVDSYYFTFDKELINLVDRKKILDEEYNAVCTACAEIEERLEALKVKAEYKKAVREGAVLETQMARMRETIDASQFSIDKFNRRLTSIVEDIAKLDNDIAVRTKSSTELRELIISDFPGKEEAMNAVTIIKQGFYKDHITVAAQQQEIAAIDTKIGDNEDACKLMTEDFEALKKAKQTVEGYIAQNRKSIVALEEKLIKEKTNLQFIESIDKLEYGEKCPVCAATVLNKREVFDDLTAKNSLIEQLNKDLAKFKNIEIEYTAKLGIIDTKLGDIEAKITISNGYVRSLRETKKEKHLAINNILRDNGLSTVPELTNALNKAINRYNVLFKANEQLAEEEAFLNVANEQKAVLVKEKTLLEEEDLPRAIEVNRVATDTYKDCEEKYLLVRPLFGEKMALELYNELTLNEKETETLLESLETNRTKKNSVFLEKDEVDKMILLLGSRGKDVVIDGVPHNYQQVVKRVMAERLMELVNEIKRSDAELESIKAEIGGIKRVLNRHIAEKDAKIKLLNTKRSALAANEAVVNDILADYDQKAEELNARSLKDLEKLVMPEDKKAEALKEIASNTAAIAILNSSIEKNRAIYEANKEQVDSKNSNLETKLAIETATSEAQTAFAKKSLELEDKVEKARLLSDFRDEAEKTSAAINVLNDIINIVAPNGYGCDDFLKYYISEADKVMFAASNGKYGFTKSNDSVALVLKSKNKIIEKYSKLEKQLATFVLNAVFTNFFFIFVSGKILPSLCAYNAKDSSKELAFALATYAKDKDVIVATNGNTISGDLQKVI